MITIDENSVLKFNSFNRHHFKLSVSLNKAKGLSPIVSHMKSVFILFFGWNVRLSGREIKCLNKNNNNLLTELSYLLIKDRSASRVYVENVAKQVDSARIQPTHNMYPLWSIELSKNQLLLVARLSSTIKDVDVLREEFSKATPSTRSKLAKSNFHCELRTSGLVNIIRDKYELMATLLQIMINMGSEDKFMEQISKCKNGIDQDKFMKVINEEKAGGISDNELDEIINKRKIENTAIKDICNNKLIDLSSEETINIIAKELPVECCYSFLGVNHIEFESESYSNANNYLCLRSCLLIKAIKKGGVNDIDSLMREIIKAEHYGVISIDWESLRLGLAGKKSRKTTSSDNIPVTVDREYTSSNTIIEKWLKENKVIANTPMSELSIVHLQSVVPLDYIYKGFGFIKEYDYCDESYNTGNNRIDLLNILIKRNNNETIGSFVEFVMKYDDIDTNNLLNKLNMLKQNISSQDD